jgi:hypothetical protein
MKTKIQYCYTKIGIFKSLDGQFTWAVALFQDVKTKKGCGQLSEVTLKGNWNYGTQEEALEKSKKILKVLGIVKRKN